MSAKVELLTTFDQRFRSATLHWGLGVRWVFLGVLLALMLISRSALSMPFPLLPFALLALLVAASNVIYGRRLAAGKGHGLWLEAQIGLDVAVITLIIQFTGGIDSPFAWLAVGPIMMAGLMGGWRLGGAAAIAGWMLYGLVLMGQYWEWLPHIHVDILAAHDITKWESLHLISVTIAIHGLLFALAASLSSWFHTAVSWASRDLAEAHTDLQEKERLRQRLLQRLVRSQEEERLRISRDLHDEITQLTSAVMLYLEPVVTGKTTSLPQVVEKAGLARKTAGESLDVLERLIEDLRPPVLDQMGVAHAVEHQLQRLEGLGLETEFFTNVRARLSAEIEITLFRVVQEALTNVVRHAEARWVQVAITREGEQLHVTVRDDGRGFAVDASRATGKASLGLLGMQERMASLGGTVEVYSVPGQGTTVLARLAWPEGVESSNETGARSDCG